MSQGDSVSPEVTGDPIGRSGNMRKQAFKELAGTVAPPALDLKDEENY